MRKDLGDDAEEFWLSVLCHDVCYRVEKGGGKGTVGMKSTAGEEEEG
jgi:predicted hydrolase (HD superfamily)